MDLALDQSWGESINALVRKQIAGFPNIDLTRTDAWSRAPRTRVLPDRFVLLLYRTEDAAPEEHVGELIPDSVFLGPDPLAPDTTLATKDHALTLSGLCEWVANFDTAVTQGLGFKVPLSEQQANEGFTRIIVPGLKISAGAGQGAQLLEELIADHQYSPKGFSLVAQGTPTNNTERDGSGFSDNQRYNHLAFFTELDPPTFDPEAADPTRSQTDGRLLADALGISYARLQAVQNADQTDVLEACMMNTALFPGTLGYWLKNWMPPIVTVDAARHTRPFFTQYVTGRGPLPAIRVGNQPYGVLVTSDLSRWKYTAPQGAMGRIGIFDGDTAYLASLHSLLVRLEEIWKSHQSELAYIGKPGSDSSEVLMNLLSLNATSLDLYQRIGFHEQYLRELVSFTQARPSYQNELDALKGSTQATMRLYLQRMGIAADIPTVSQMLALHVLWQHYAAGLTVPNLVDSKPASEQSTLMFNYIDWLATAETTSKIIGEQFAGAKPVTLLYLMLRNALLLQLHHGSYEWLAGHTTLDPSLQQALNTPALAGIRPSTPSVSKYELMAVRVESVQADHPAPGMSVGDWIWGGPNDADVEGAFLKAQRVALGLLAKVPTARLERCLIEHLDCCQYRLDAWETALFAQRLQTQRASVSQNMQRRTGINLGAFGWVEQVQRTPRTTLRPEDLPEVLRPADTGPLFEEEDVPGPSRVIPGSRRGGYTHAPSISHAAAAALLHNAYLTHSSSELADALSNNLSSDRVRRAQFVLEGLRNGQPIEALLGYQFERALHDRTSASAASGAVPVLELNEFILPYRTAFPFTSREIPQAGTGPAAETVPPFSVVNGLALSQASLSAANGFGLTTVLSASDLPKADQGAAVVAVQGELLEAIDAVKDLLMAENAYQLVQGNFDRVAAVSLAQKDARVPPVLEVVNTPRGSHFTFTNRVTLHFDDIDPSLDTSSPWPNVPITSRAYAEPGLNFWLGTILGRDCSRVSCAVWQVGKAADGSETRENAGPVTLADLQLQPIDLIALTGINTQQSQGGATELEMRIARHYRDAQAVSDEATVRIDFDAAVPAGQLTFGQIFPLARRLRSLLSDCRPLDARDFLPAAGGKTTLAPIDPKNPTAYDVADLRARVQAAMTSLTDLADRFDGPKAPNVDLTLMHEGGAESFSGLLGAAFAKLDAAGIDFGDLTAVQTTLSLLAATEVRSTLAEVALFGIPDAFPPESDLTSEASKTTLLSRARRVARRLRRMPQRDGVLDRAAASFSAATADKPIADQVSNLLQAGQVVFADTLRLIPQFICYNEVDLAASASDRAELLSYALSRAPGLTTTELLDEWLQGLARVRPRMSTWETARTLADALNDVTLEALPVQVPYRAKDRWLAVEFPEQDPLGAQKPFGIVRDTLSIVAHGGSAFRAGVAQRGLLLDEWTEEIPTARENTGISFRFNQPNAVPPQTLLLAITPEETGSWSWDALVGTLLDTLARAKRRAVEPAQLEKDGSSWNTLSPALVAEFSALYQADVSLDYLLPVKYSELSNFYSAITKPED
jgi:hypothetical protein